MSLTYIYDRSPNRPKNIDVSSRAKSYPVERSGQVDSYGQGSIASGKVRPILLLYFHGSTDNQQSYIGLPNSNGKLRRNTGNQLYQRLSRWFINVPDHTKSRVTHIHLLSCHSDAPII